MQDVVGIIGQGPIGRHFAEKLTGEYDTIVYDLDHSLMEKAISVGAKAVDSLADMAVKANIVVLALPGDKALHAVMDGENGLVAMMKDGQFIIDTGTSTAELDRHYHAVCNAKSLGFLEAPVSWREGGLLLMPAGDRDVFDRLEAVIRCMSCKYCYVGESGRGQELKSVNQMLFSARVAIEAECVAYAEKLGFSEEIMEDFMGFGLNRRLYGDDFSRILGTSRLNYKDLLYTFQIAHEHGAFVPITQAVYEAFKYAVFNGAGDEDQPGIIKYWRQLNEGE